MDQLRAQVFQHSSSECLIGIFDNVACGAILIDETRHVIATSPRARTLIGDGLLLKRGQLHAVDRGTDALLQQSLDALLRRSQGVHSQALGIPRRGVPRPLILRLIAVQAEGAPALDGAALIAILVDPEVCTQPAQTLLQQVFGLTKGEARVASLLLSGIPFPAIASSVGGMVMTVRTQAKSIFAKTHTTRQSDLVALLTRLALISGEDCASWRRNLA